MRQWEWNTKHIWWMKHSNDWQVNSRSSFKSVYRQVNLGFSGIFLITLLAQQNKNVDALKIFCCQMCRNESHRNSCGSKGKMFLRHRASLIGFLENSYVNLPLHLPYLVNISPLSMFSLSEKKEKNRTVRRSRKVSCKHLSQNDKNMTTVYDRRWPY